MPYISQEARKAIDVGVNPTTSGELTYAIYQLIFQYWKNNKGLGFGAIAHILGALDSAHQEFYRNIVVPYEDAKKQEHGDI